MEKPESYVQQLRPYRRNVVESSITVLLARPLVCMIYPAVLWAFFLGGCWSTWVCRPDNRLLMFDAYAATERSGSHHTLSAVLDATKSV